MNQTETNQFFAPPNEARAALYFLEGHYQFNYREGAIEKTKFLSPAQIGKAFSTQKAFDSGWVNANILRFSEEKERTKILSFLPRARRKLLLTNPQYQANSATETGHADLAVLEITVPLPALLLLGCGQKYWLWATLDENVTEKSKICVAPFPNLDSSGGICFGGNIAPECRLDTIETVWRLFFESPFNNHQANNRCRPHPHDAREFLISINGKSKLPKKALITTNHTVGEQWQSVRWQS